MSLKDKIKEQFGTMRAAAVETGINYYRISQIVNGWIVPKPAEIKSLGITNEYNKRGKSGISRK